VSGFEKTQVCRAVPYDNSASGMQAENAQAAIDELRFSSLPPFTWSRQGNTPSNTWLQNDAVPSNITGRWVYLYDAKVNTIFVANQSVATYSISFYHHDGDGAAMTLLGSVTVTAARGGEFQVSWSVPKGKQVAARVTAGSVANIVAGATISGRLTA
jgi:hypothetical protein